MRTKTTLIVVLMFVVALAAGAVAGKLASRQQQATRTSAGSSLTDDLKLTPEQRDRMRQIWESVRDTADSCRKDAEAAQNEQLEQLKAMLNEDQRRRYAELTSATSIKIQVLDEKRKAAVRQAIDQTEKLLSEEQRKAYRQIIKDRLGAVPDQMSQAPALLERSDLLPLTE